ncbi:two-component system activity regulator YycH [Fructilactobacillus vespulae]|uniref:two-component system activity regulator YycH n=1 Tax=Fructilactobacillus vespulae TaxID=1249630 RepID=UPI0039B64385
MMEKLKQYWLPSLLGIAVLISLIMTVSLLTNPARYSSNNNESQSSSFRKETNSYDLGDVYSPTQLIEAKDKDQYLVTSSSTNVVGEVFKEMQKFQYSHVKKISENNKDEYYRIANQSDMLMLNYNNPISSNILAKIFNYDGFNDKGSIKRILLSTNKDKYVYLLNDDHYMVYRAEVSDLNLKKIKSITDDQVTRNRVELKTINGNPFIYFPGQIKMKDYGYMLREENEGTYLNRIIGSTSNASIKHHTDKVIYSSQNKDLTFDNNGDVIYTNYRPTQKIKSEAMALNSAYQNAIELGFPLDSTKFDTYNKDEKTVSFRQYIEGFPVYSNEQLGVYTYKFLNGNTERYSFSLREFLVPVPTDKQATTLPSSKTLLSDLEKSKVDMKQISGMRLGYQLVPDSENKLIVTMQPTWFVKYNDQWLNYKYLDTQVREGDSDEL